jgi:hypothetical protein
MSEELSFLNFCISFNRKLTDILESKITNSKKFEDLTSDDVEILRLLHFGHDHMGLEFGNDNRNPHDLRAGEQK